MERGYVDISLPNIVSITVQAIFGLMLVALIVKLGAKYVPGVTGNGGA